MLSKNEKKRFSGIFEKPYPNIILTAVLLIINISLLSIYHALIETNLIIPCIFTSIFTILIVNYLYYKRKEVKFKTDILSAAMSCFFVASFIIPLADTYDFPVYLYFVFGAAIFLNSYLVCLAARRLLSDAKLERRANRMHWYDLPLFMSIPLIINAVAFLGVFPGVTWFDTAYCWSMVIRTSYSDAHPILYLMLLRGLYLIWDNIAIVSIFQIVLVSFTYGYAAYRLKQLGLNTKLCYALVFVIAIIPGNLLVNMQVLKDIPYTMGLILLSIEILRMLSDGGYFKRFSNYVLLFVWVMIIIATRHNGIFIAGLSFVFLIIYFLKNYFLKASYRLIYLFIAAVLLFSAMKEYSINNVRNFTENLSNSYGAYTIPVQGLMEVYDKHFDDMDEVEKGVLTKYLNEEFAREYINANRESRFWQFHGLYQNALNWQIMKGNEADFVKTYLHYFKMYPKDMIMSYLRITAIVWSIPEYNHTEYPAIESYESQNPELIMTEPDSKSKLSLGWLEIWHKTTEYGIGKVLFWRPALVMAAIIFIAALKKNKLIVYFMLPAILNHMGYLFVIQAQDFRYFYAGYTIFFIVLVLALFNIDSYYTDKRVYSLDIELDRTKSERLEAEAAESAETAEKLILGYIMERLDKDKK